MIKKITFTLFILSQFGGVCEAKTLTEADILSSVTRNYPMIMAAKANIEKARAEYLSSQGAFDPSINSKVLISPNGIYQNGLANAQLNIPVPDSGNKVFTGYRIGRGNYPPYDQDRETFNYGEFRVGIEMPFYRDRSIDDRRAKIMKAGLGEKISEDDFRITKLKTNLEATLSYWDWVADGRQYLIQKNMLNIALTRQTALDHSVHAGDAAEIDSVDNQRIIMQRKAAVRMYEALLQKSSLLLSLYYRDQSGKPIYPDINSLPSVNNADSLTAPAKITPSAIEGAVTMHPGIQLLSKQHEMALVSLKQANNNLMPMLNNKIYIAQDLGGGNPPLNRTTINYELTFDLPFNQRDARGQIEAANNALIKIDNERKLQSEQIAVKIRQSLAQIQASKSIINYTHQETEMALRVQKAEDIKYTHGESNLFVLNQRELSTAEAETRYVDAVRNYNITLAQLRYAIGAGV